VQLEEYLNAEASAIATNEVIVTPDGVVPLGADAPPEAPQRLRPLGRKTVLLAAGTAVLFGLAASALAPARLGDKQRLVHIPRDASVAQIAEYLQDKDIIRSAYAFRLLARLTGVDRSLRAGAYRLPGAAWAWSVLAELHRGQVQTRTVTIPEGLTLVEVASLLDKAGLAQASDVLREAHSPHLLETYGIPATNVEGYLFPETYVLADGLSAREILTVMIEELHARLAQIPQAQGLTASELMRTITLASIVEREARDESELPRVAGVFVNRLERNMRLESCATVQYILGRPKARLTVADVRRPSPYNTYLHPGLPPGPIASPGMAALRASLAPEQHDFLFFFAREDGSHRHVFSRTFAQHREKQRQMRNRH
jgi:UPF0755 protein